MLTEVAPKNAFTKLGVYAAVRGKGIERFVKTEHCVPFGGVM
jgi:hypothetical protein